MEIGFDPKQFLKRVSSRPGVYRMKDASGQIIYVGKASNLRNRLNSYFSGTADSPKTRHLVSHIADIEVTITGNEQEALLLENHLIKAHRPRYNVVFRDDKSYPYVYLSCTQDFPRLAFHRGAKASKGRYFGPYPNAGAVRATLNILQKTFKIRLCEDSFFRNRTRPCLQHQINRCTAPCVGFIDAAQYQDDIQDAVMYLEGKDDQVVARLAAKMEAAAGELQYEYAAELRDKIANVQRVREQQQISQDRGDVDVAACISRDGVACVQLFMIREGRNLGNKAFYPKLPQHSSVEDVLYAFLTQYYLKHPAPREIIVSHPLKDSATIAEAIAQRSPHRVLLRQRPRGAGAKWLRMALSNADIALQARLSSRAGMSQRLHGLMELLDLAELPERIDCFDVSHTQGDATVAACVVFDMEGPNKSLYRRFNIKGLTPGDDYAAIEQALERHFTRLLKEDRRLPDVLIIDGGKGQLRVAAHILEELQLGSQIRLLAVAKGASRRPGLETLLVPGSKAPLNYQQQTPGMHLIQQIRDEAHRFAIMGHRQQRAKQRTQSILETIPGLGPKRRQQLLKQFGGLQGLKRANLQELQLLPGIGQDLAERLYHALHEDAVI